MKRAIDAFLSIFSVVSRIPVRVRFVPTYADSGFYLPVVGIIVGLIAATVGGLVLLLDSGLSALVILLVQYSAFNLFHFDGLLDTADALLPYAARERRLEILRDSRIGSFAMFVGFLSLAAKLYLIARVLGSAVPNGLLSGPRVNLSSDTWSRVGLLFAILFCYPVSGRAAAALIPAVLKPARSDGLGALLTVYHRGPAVAGALLAAAVPVVAGVIVGVVTRGLKWQLIAVSAAIGVVAAAAASFCVASAYRSRIEGFTGDALGAAVELGELIHILLLFVMLQVVLRFTV